MEKYHFMILNVLKNKLGPAAEDFATEQCSTIGISFETLSPKNIEPFAGKVEEKAAELTSEFDARFMANVIRKLKKI